jgi:hypothetical protein
VLLVTVIHSSLGNELANFPTNKQSSGLPLAGACANRL